MFRSRALPGAALLCALTSAALVAHASGAEPAGGARFAVHDHATPGDGWHMELEVAPDARQLRSLVLHAERCNATVLAENLPVGPDGVLALQQSFTSRGRQGTWRLDGQFTDPLHLRASFEARVGACDGGVRTVEAHAEGHHGGAGGHEHHGHTSATAPGTYPVLDRATARRRAQARRLWRASLRAARDLFPTYHAALRRGFRRYPRTWRKPLIFHVRRAGYDHDGRWLDPRRPESLVYWWPAGRQPVLIAFMYRYPLGGRPPFGAPLFGWHTHGARPNNQMTHVWMTRTLRTALANCVPVAALEAANPRFRWSAPTQSGGHNTEPCPAPAAATMAARKAVRVGDNYFVRSRGVPTVTVSRGDRVTWRFAGQDPHNVHAVRGPARFRSPTRQSGSYSRRMTRRGTYTIICDIHGGRDQKMKLVVRSG